MLAHRLVAHGIGGRTVRELSEGRTAGADGMDSEEFLRWAAFLQMEPLPETRADVHTAMIMAQQYNMNRPKGKAAKRPADFMPQWARSERSEQSMDEMKESLRARYLRMRGDPSLMS